MSSCTLCMQTYLTISHWHSTQCIYHGMAIIDRTHCFFHSSVSNLTSSSSLALVAVGSSSSAPVSEVLFSGWRWLTRFFRLVCPPSSSPPVALSNLLDTYTRNTEYHAHKGGYLTANTISCYTYCLHYMHTHIIDSVTLFQRKYTCIYMCISINIPHLFSFRRGCGAACVSLGSSTCWGSPLSMVSTTWRATLFLGLFRVPVHYGQDRTCYILLTHLWWSWLSQLWCPHWAGTVATAIITNIRDDQWENVRWLC